MSVRIERDKCTACESCLAVCPHDAIVIKEGKAFINEYCQMCSACLTVCPEGAITEYEAEKGLEVQDLNSYRGIWVFAEQRKKVIAPVSFELLGAGRRLADTLQVELSAVLLGGDEALASELIKWGADKVYLSDHQIFDSFNDEPYAGLLASLVNKYKPEVVLAGATAIGRSFLPRVAAKLRCGLTADCTGLEIEGETRNLVQTRPAYGGNIMASILCPKTRPQMATVRPKVMKKGEYDEARRGEIIRVEGDGLTSGTKVLESVKDQSSHKVNLQEADVIISGGRGLKTAEGFQLLSELASLLNGAVGASRAAVDEGWIPYSHQVGQTGKTVCPKLYIACGISGAVQHLVGMQSSDHIVAINKNEEAPIFNVATYGLVGDLYEILPLLIKKIREIKEK
jgi:electron transfer flavoprotein alpha subunit